MYNGLKGHFSLGFSCFYTARYLHKKNCKSNFVRT